MGRSTKIPVENPDPRPRVPPIPARSRGPVQGPGNDLVPAQLSLSHIERLLLDGRFEQCSYSEVHPIVTSCLMPRRDIDYSTT